jgi:translation elongation factor EF-G
MGTDRSKQMNDDKFNMEMRKFLKKVGVTSQREIENAVNQAMSSGAIVGSEVMKVKMTLEIAELGLTWVVDGEIALE